MLKAIVRAAAALFFVAALASCSAPSQPTTRSSAALAASSTRPTLVDKSRSLVVETILAQTKGAMGGTGWDKIHSLRTEGTISMKAAKISGTTRQLDDLVTGRSVTDNHLLGSLHTAWGFDGKSTWVRTPRGITLTQYKSVPDKMYRTRAYRAARAWWYPQRWPAKIESLGIQKIDGASFVVLKITPSGGNPFQLWINAETHLLARFVVHSGSSIKVVHLGDYRTIDGVKIAFQRKTIVNGKTRLVQQLGKASINVPVARTDFIMPSHPATLIGGVDRVTVPFKPVGDWVYLDGKVNGHPTLFLLDSNWGRVAAVTSAAAKVSGLVGYGARMINLGAGAGSLKLQSTSAKSIVLANAVKLDDPALNIIPTSKLTKSDPNQGAIGEQVLDHFVTRIDYATHKVTFIKPDAFDPRHAGTAIPLTETMSGALIVKGAIDGIPARFVVDTGNRGTLFLHSPFAKEHHLYSHYHATAPVPTGKGVGGVTTSRIARADTLMIGTTAVQDPLVNLSMATQGAFASNTVDGNIGGRILKRFTVTFDVPQHRLYLKPNKNYGKPMGESWFLNHAGLFAKKTKPGFLVTTILPGSPAAQAGIAKGDLVTSVNGKPAAPLSRLAFRKLLRDGAPGTQMRLGVNAGKAPHTITFTLRRLLPET